jgi:hypothetical protein
MGFAHDVWAREPGQGRLLDRRSAGLYEIAVRGNDFSGNTEPLTMVRTGFTDPALAIVSFAGVDPGLCADSEHEGKTLGAPGAAG